MLYGYLTSAVRTAVPAGVGWVFAWLLSKGIDVPAETREWAVSGLTFLILMGYYLLVRALELKFPSLGWLLGSPAKPVYYKKDEDGVYRPKSSRPLPYPHD